MIINLPWVSTLVYCDVGRRYSGASPAFEGAGQADGNKGSDGGQVDQLTRVLLDVEQARWHQRVAAGRLRLPRPATHLSAFPHARDVLLRQPRAQRKHRCNRGARLRPKHAADVVVGIAVAPRRLAVPRVHPPVLSRSCKKWKNSNFVAHWKSEFWLQMQFYVKALITFASSRIKMPWNVRIV